MNQSITADDILQYIGQLQPKGPLAVAAATDEIRSMMTALLDCTARINAPRKLALLKEETTNLQAEYARLEATTTQLRLLDREREYSMETLEKLRTEHELVKDLGKRKEEIETLKSILAQHDIPSLSEELTQLLRNTATDQRHLHELIKELDTFFTQLHIEVTAETKTLWSAIQERRKAIDNDLETTRANIAGENVQLSELISQYETRLAQTQADYQAGYDYLQALRTKLTDIQNLHDQNIKTYELHFANNQEIYGELGKRHALDQYITRLSEEVRSALQRYDRDIRNMVERSANMTIF